jgi:hypothetical protein
MLVENWIMPTRDSRRQRQQLMVDCDMTLLLREEEELESEELDEVLARCCSGSAAGRWAAAVCNWRRRDASPGWLDIDSNGVGRMAKRGLLGSAKVCGE